jgi:hypothetical protein
VICASPLQLAIWTSLLWVATHAAPADEAALRRLDLELWVGVRPERFSDATKPLEEV